MFFVGHTYVSIELIRSRKNLQLWHFWQKHRQFNGEKVVFSTDSLGTTGYAYELQFLTYVTNTI